MKSTSYASNPTKKFQIGTANFGTKYGISGTNSGLKQENLDEIFEIIARNKSISLDTATGYANSLQTIAKYSSSLNLTGRISTKISLENVLNRKLVLDEVKKSLDLLNIDFFSEIYLHGFQEHYKEYNSELKMVLEALIDSGYTKKVGMSCYSETEVISTSNLFPQMSIFQVPENILDQRLKDSISLKNMKNSGVEFMVRSVFLQGLLLMKIAEIPNYFESFKPSVIELNRIADSAQTTVLELCIQYVKNIEWAGGLVVGVNSSQQLLQLIDIFNNQVKTNDFPVKPFRGDLIDPRNWTMLK